MRSAGLQGVRRGLLNALDVGRPQLPLRIRSCGAAPRRPAPRGVAGDEAGNGIPVQVPTSVR
jgi:hypothetical protein